MLYQNKSLYLQLCTLIWLSTNDTLWRTHKSYHGMHKHPTCLKRKIKVMIQMQILKCTLQNQIVVYK